MVRRGSRVANFARVADQKRLWLASVTSAFERAVLDFAFSFLEVGQLDPLIPNYAAMAPQVKRLLADRILGPLGLTNIKAFTTLFLRNLGHTLPW
jgi:hypothetical protein